MEPFEFPKELLERAEPLEIVRFPTADQLTRVDEVQPRTDLTDIGAQLLVTMQHARGAAKSGLFKWYLKCFYE